MDDKAIFNQLLHCMFFPEEDLSKAQNILKETLNETFDQCKNSNKTMLKLFDTRYAWDVNAEILLLQNIFLNADRIEEKVRMKDKEKHKSILLWLMDNLDDDETDFIGMIGRAVGLFGSVLGCIKTKKSKNGSYKHNIICNEWETEY